MSSFTFESPSSDPKTSAIIANFTNGRLNHEQSDQLNYGYFESVTQGKRGSTSKMLVAESRTMQYRGNKTDESEDKTSKYYVLLRDKNSGKVKVLGAERFTLSPYALADGQTLTVSTEDNTADNSFREKSDALTGAFGSSKKKKAMESRLKFQLSGDLLDAAVSAAVDAAFDEQEGKTMINRVPDDTAPTGLPPFDKSATEPKDIYNIDNIMKPSTVESLKTLAVEMMEADNKTLATWKAENKYSGFILQQLGMLPVDHCARERRACSLLYLHQMMRMYVAKARDIKSKNFFSPEIPKLVCSDLLQTFTLMTPDNKGKLTRYMPHRLKDKLLSYILITCLILEHCSLNYTSLPRDLATSLDKLTNHLRAAGCTISAAPGGVKGSKLAVLKAPLTFPVVKKRKAARR